MWRAVWALLLGAGLLLGCAGGSEVGNPEARVFSTFTADGETEAYLKKAYAQSLVPASAATDDEFDGGGEIPGAPDGETPGFFDPGFSVENIDPLGPERVESSGNHLFVTDGNGVTVLDVTDPGSPRVRATISVPGHADGLHLDGGTLAVLYTPPGGGGEFHSGMRNAPAGPPAWVPEGAQTGLLMVDVSDPRTPLPLRRIEMDGFPMVSRSLGRSLVLVSQYVPDLPELSDTFDGTAADRTRQIAENEARLAALTLDDLLPGYAVWSGDGSLEETGRLLPPGGLFRPENVSGGSVAGILTFPMDDPSAPFGRTGIVADIHGVRVSPEGIYLAGTAWTDEGGGSYFTPLFRFDLAGGNVRPTAAGRVDGRLAGPAALGTHGGYVSLGTVMDESAAPTVTEEYRVRILGTAERTLSTEGILDPLPSPAETPEIYLDGPWGYVTFAPGAEADPVLLDLSDPNRPRIAGALPVAGTPVAVRRVNGNHLLTVSEAADGDMGGGRPSNLTVALFDAGGPGGVGGPVPGQEMTLSGGAGPVSAEAILYDAAAGILSVPVGRTGSDTVPGSPEDRRFGGFALFRVTADAGIVELGSPAAGGFREGGPDWIRQKIMGDTLFLVGDGFAGTVDLRDPGSDADTGIITF